MKHLFTKSKTFALLALSLLTGIGVFSGISAANKQAEAVNAATPVKKVYIRPDSTYWSASGEKVAAWCWGGTAGGGQWYKFNNTNDKITKLRGGSGADTVYKLDASFTFASFILIRGNSSWGQQSWPNDDTNAWNQTNTVDVVDGVNLYKTTSYNAASSTGTSIWKVTTEATNTGGTTLFEYKEPNWQGWSSEGVNSTYLYFYQDWHFKISAYKATGYDFRTYQYSTNEGETYSDFTGTPTETNHSLSPNCDVKYRASFTSKGYTLKVFSGGTERTSISLDLNSGTEYVTSEPIQLYSGEVLAVYKNSSTEPETMNAKQVSNNNCWNNLGVTTVCLNKEDYVYVDIGQSTIFCAGLSVNVFGMVINNNYYGLTYNQTPITDFEEWYIINHTFSTNDQIKFVDTHSNNGASGKNAHVFSIEKIDNESLVSNFEVDSGNHCIKCTSACTSSAYAKFKSGLDEVYFGNEDYAIAVTYAKTFNGCTGEVCDNQGHTILKDLSDEWVSLEDAYDEIEDASAKTFLKTATSSSGTSLAAFAARYDYIFSKYKTRLSLTDFADRFGNGGAGVATGGSLLHRGTIIEQNNSSIVVIIVITSSGLLLLSASALLLFLKKKKKQD